MVRHHVLHRALDWLVQGYPDGIPAKDYSPILALLGREQLTDEEVGTSPPGWWTKPSRTRTSSNR